MSSAAPADAAPAAAAKPAKGKGGMGMILAAVVLSVAASGGISFFLSKKAASAAVAAAGEAGGHGAEGHDAAAAPPAAANYLGLDPAFVVNLEDPIEPHFLQADIQVMSRDAAAIEGVKTHLPRIRSALLMLLGAQKPADLTTRAGKEKLQAEVLAEVQKVMQEETGKPVVEAVYFTSFVMQ